MGLERVSQSKEKPRTGPDLYLGELVTWPTPHLEDLTHMFSFYAKQSLLNNFSGTGSDHQIWKKPPN